MSTSKPPAKGHCISGDVGYFLSPLSLSHSPPLPLSPSSPSHPLPLSPSSPLPLFPSPPLPLFPPSALPLFPSSHLPLFPSPVSLHPSNRHLGYVGQAGSCAQTCQVMSCPWKKHCVEEVPGGVGTCECEPGYVARGDYCAPTCAVMQCGEHQVCEMVNRAPTCLCEPGYLGNPGEKCTRMYFSYSHSLKWFRYQNSCKPKVE
ncbi:unnamed protein product, partial [Closterium sp. NIES-54]